MEKKIMTLKEKIRARIKSAMTEKRALELSVLRMLMAAVLNKEKEKRARLSKEEKDPEELEKLSKLGDEEVLEVISSEAKKRKDSIEQYRKGGRDDLADQEKQELEILTEYLPEQVSEDEIRKTVKEKIEETGAAGPQETGKIMGLVMPLFKGRADGSLVSRIVQEELKKS